MIEIKQGDCMEYMATLEDNAFELAIVDPPYGIGMSHKNENGWKENSTSLECKEAGTMNLCLIRGLFR